VRTFIAGLYAALNPLIFHWSPEKAVEIGGGALLWDARCAGIYIGIGIGVLWHICTAPTSCMLPPRAVRRLLYAMLVPMFLDVLSLATFLREASNGVRFATGILFGGAFTAWMYPAFAAVQFRRGGNLPALGSVTSLVKFGVISGVPLVLTWAGATAGLYLLDAIAIVGFLALLAMFSVALGTAAVRWARVVQRKGGWPDFPATFATGNASSGGPSALLRKTFRRREGS